MSSPLNGQLDRRSLLRFGAAGIAVASIPSLLSGCSSSESAPSPAAGKPVRGGTLRAGFTGGSPTDTIDAARSINNIDFARTIALYEPLIWLDQDAQATNVLAESIEPNADATLWTIRLKKGVKFHSGKPLTADDVLYTLNRQVDNQYAATAALALVDLKRSRKVDDLTLELACSSPYSILDQALASNFAYLGIVPVGYDPKNPVGTGPFSYKSFTPGQESVFTSNADYWGQVPYVDSLVITNYQDETAQLNALQSSQVDLINQLSVASIELAKTSGQVLVAEGGGMTPLVMRCDKPPFDDVRVRQAMRLVVDRDKMNDVVFGGHATIGNDIFSIHDPDIDKSMPQRTRDVDKAKSLLAEAGQSDLTVELVVAEISYGAVQTAQVFAQQAKDAGITVNIKKIPVAEMFGSNFLSWDFSIDAWYYAPYLPMAAYTTTPGAPFPETHFNNDRYNELYNQAIATVDASERRKLSQEMQMIDYNEGGYIIPYFAANIDAYASKVGGVQPSKTGMSFGNFDFKSMWIS